METKKTVTPMEGLNIAIEQLLNISVPVGFTEQISIPLSKAVNLIQQCIPFLMVKPEEPQEPAEEIPEDATIIDLGELKPEKET